ncbi:hypothetical protein A1O1_04925 [Capronia coronata CBS 617.96]|uniref:DUF895 domain membrane protein n=1 Tax=Capronia coronata CBS 617.96 TaxID=1182541 RepID=W9Y641_9EURO|nr:uncharacterized protein A1O1_04925 [Capronia coronata CBS 617.96]EXJ87998.1 hypothetical protein A1O1_04925 [Capronia coronata CBS 617.96]
MASRSESSGDVTPPLKEDDLAVSVLDPDQHDRKDEGLAGEYPQEKIRVPLFRSTRFQAAVIAGVFFCGPGMYSALNALGAGGLRSPHLVNITQSMSYGENVLFALLTGVVVNIFGERLTLSAGVAGFSIYGASLYCNNRYGKSSSWFLYFSAALQGVLTAILWVVQAAVMLAYPEPDFKGRFISIWYASIACGQAVGGIIALGFNARNAEAGSITPNSYIPLIAIAGLGPFIALLLSSPAKVVRRDGVRVTSNKQSNPWQEAKNVFSALKRREMVMLIPLFIFSQWFLSYNNNFTAIYHSVRGRSLSGFLSAVWGIAGTFSFGTFLDSKTGWGFAPTRAARLRLSFYVIYALYTMVWVWATVVQWYYSKTHPVGLDWTDGEFYASFMLLLFWAFVDHAFQTFMYATVGSLTDDVDELERYTGFLKAVNTGGAALGYAVQVEWSMMGSEALLLGLWVIQIWPTWLVIRRLTK